MNRTKKIVIILIILGIIFVGIFLEGEINITTGGIEQTLQTSQTLPTEKGTLEVKLSHNELFAAKQTKLNIDFINPQTQKIQEHVDYTITVSKNSESIFGPIPLTHTSVGSVKIPIKFLQEGTYSVDLEIEGILFQPIPKERVSFDVIVGEENVMPPS